MSAVRARARARRPTAQRASGRVPAAIDSDTTEAAKKAEAAAIEVCCGARGAHRSRRRDGARWRVVGAGRQRQAGARRVASGARWAAGDARRVRRVARQRMMEQEADFAKQLARSEEERKEMERENVRRVRESEERQVRYACACACV